MNQTLKTGLALILGLAIMASPAQAANIDSVYTQLDLDACNQLDPAAFGDDLDEGTQGGRFACVGYNNSLVYVSEGDLRMFVSYGLNALNEPAAHQTLGPFNYLGSTLEWRVNDASGQWVPFATILRWHTQVGDGSSPDGQTLIVTKLEEGNTCHIAHVDARAIPNANEVARQFADNLAPNFNCATDQIHRVPN